jgi:hypothetical protein
VVRSFTQQSQKLYSQNTFFLQGGGFYRGLNVAISMPVTDFSEGTIYASEGFETGRF